MVEAGYELNAPLRAVPTTAREGQAARRSSFLRVDRPGVVVDAVKKAEDSDNMVVRLYEALGQRGPVRLTCAKAVADVRRANLLERPESKVELASDGSIPLSVQPFEIVTLLLRA